MEQVKVRDYQTKHFDICPVATSLYKNIESKGVNMEDAEAAARVQDGLFALEKKVIEKGEASHNEVARAIYLQDIIMDFAEKMELESDHSYVQGHVDKIKSYKDSVNENIKSKINSLYKAAKKKLGVKNVVRPTDADFDAAYKHIEDNYPEGYTLMSIGVDAIQDKINIEVGDFYGESEDIVIDRPSVNEEEGFSFDEKGKPVEKNLDQALKDLFAKIKKQMSDEDKKKLEGAIKEAINSFNETVELGKNLTEELCAKGKAYIKKRKAAGEKSSAYLSGRAVKVCKGQMKG